MQYVFAQILNPTTKLGVGGLGGVISWAGFKVDHWQVTGIKIKTNIPILVYNINNLLTICIYMMT